jgi:hypothetical protein
VSYKTFTKDLNNLYREFKASNRPAASDYEDDWGIVRDQWMAAGRFEDLIEFILENWNEGNCDKFIAPLEPVLLKQHPDLFRTLWDGIIELRIRMMKDWISKHSLQSIGLNAVNSKDTSSFVATSRTSYSDPVQVLAYFRNFTLEGIVKYQTALIHLNDSEGLARLQALLDAVANLWKNH